MRQSRILFIAIVAIPNLAIAQEYPKWSTGVGVENMIITVPSQTITVAITIKATGEVEINWKSCEEYINKMPLSDISSAVCKVAIAVRDGKAISK